MISPTPLIVFWLPGVFRHTPMPNYRTFIGDGVVKLMLRALPETHRDEATVQACVGAYVQEYERTWNAQTKPYAWRA